MSQTLLQSYQAEICRHDRGAPDDSDPCSCEHPRPEGDRVFSVGALHCHHAKPDDGANGESREATDDDRVPADVTECGTDHWRKFYVTCPQAFRVYEHDEEVEPELTGLVTTT